MKPTAFFLKQSLIALMPLAALAQQPARPDTLPVRRLQAVTVEANRLGSVGLRTPLAVTVIDAPRLQTGHQQLSLFESLNAVPGVFVQNADNFAQDLRLSIRGFGARASFGIRGLKVLLDGLPESTPDGQAKLNNLDVGSLAQLEVLRGPASGLYGNAAGGVLLLRTRTPQAPFAEVATSAGSYGFRRVQGQAGTASPRGSLYLNAAWNAQQGYRAWADFTSKLLYVKGIRRVTEKTTLTLLYQLAITDANDPGGLTLPQATENRRQARPQNLTFRAMSKATQQRLGLLAEHRTSPDASWQGRVFVLRRDFDNRLAFQNGGTVGFGRWFAGGGLAYQQKSNWKSGIYRWQAGADAEFQADDRHRYDNLNGSRGNQTLHQLETFRTLGVFWLQELTLQNRWTLSANLRGDAVGIRANDRFLADGNQSGLLNYLRFSPSAGLSYALTARQSVYFNASSQFESPSLNELSSNPAGAGGFNPDLQPMRSYNAELGYKGLVSRKIQVEAALFQVFVNGEIVAYQVASQPGRAFFRNAGQSQRRGLELGSTFLLAPQLTLFANYTFSDFRYTNYQVNDQHFDGRYLPGIPAHVGYAEARYLSRSGVNATLAYRQAGHFFADDANTVRIGPAGLLNLRLGWPLRAGKLRIEPFGGASNLLDVSYFSNVQPNAAGGRYYEPAAGRTYFGGLRLSLL